MIITSVTDEMLNPSSYNVRIQPGPAGKTYLWGSEGLTTDIKFPSPLLLHIRNETFGEEINLGTEVASGTKASIGKLGPGQCVSIPIQNVSGVFATCALKSTVRCLITVSFSI